MYRGVGANVAIKTTASTNPIIDWNNIDTGYGLLFFGSTDSHIHTQLEAMHTKHMMMAMASAANQSHWKGK